MTVARESYIKKLLPPLLSSALSAGVVLFIPPDGAFPVVLLVSTVTFAFYAFLKAFTPQYYAVLGAALVLFLAVLLYFDLLYTINLVILLGSFVAASFLIGRPGRRK